MVKLSALYAHHRCARLARSGGHRIGLSLRRAHCAVTRLSPRDDRRSRQGRGVKLNAADQSATATITITAAWKQAVPATIEVFTDTNCAYPFETGREYVLFLLKDRPLAGYVTGRCMGNQPAIQADTVLRWLRRNGAVRDVSPKPQQSGALGWLAPSADRPSADQAGRWRRRQPRLHLARQPECHRSARPGQACRHIACRCDPA